MFIVIQDTVVRLMRYRHIIASLSVVAVLLSGCSSTKQKEIVPDKPAPVLYQQAEDAILIKDFREAQKQLEALDNRFPFGPYSDQAQLKLIYIYYKQNETEKALADIDRYIRNNPTGSALDYIYYMRGLTNEAANHNFSQSLLGISRATRDDSFITSAFRDYKVILEHYPNSPYAPDARRRMLKLQDQLAEHDLSVAQYYYKREAYIAAINRSKQLLEEFPDTNQVHDALRVMQRSYHKLGMTDLEQQTRKIIEAQPDYD